MRRLRRILSNALILLSTILLLGTVVLWVRSYWVSDLLHVRTAERWQFASTARGRVGAGGWLRAEWEPPGLRPLNYQHVEPRKIAGLWTSYWDSAKHRHRFAGIEFTSGSPAPEYPASFWYASVPCWLPVVIFALLPAFATSRWIRRRRRVREGHCKKCGYDLRATPDRCPECGKIPAK